MKSMSTLVLLLIVTVAVVSPSVLAQEEQAAAGTESGPNPALLDPKLATDTAPEEFKVKVETTSGDFVIRVVRKWAPHGADRFYNLVKIGYYDDTAFFRVISGFMAQIGFNGDPEINVAWRSATFPDDPIIKHNTRGIVTFAMTSRPNSRTTQFFINYADNTQLKNHGKFAGFGEVIEGMEVVDALYFGYGEGAPSGKGPSQMLIGTKGNKYLKQEFPKLDYINRATIMTD